MALNYPSTCLSSPECPRPVPPIVYHAKLSPVSSQHICLEPKLFINSSTPEYRKRICTAMTAVHKRKRCTLDSTKVGGDIRVSRAVTMMSYIISSATRATRLLVVFFFQRLLTCHRWRSRVTSTAQHVTSTKIILSNFKSKIFNAFFKCKKKN